MYAIVEIAGQQFKVAKDQRLFVHRLQDKEGAKVSFDKVFLLDDEKKVTVGAPAITGASVEAKVLGHLKGDKVIVFKKKRRKGYRVKNGHRQSLTQLVVEQINEKPAAKKVPAAKAEKPVAEKKVATKAVAAKLVAKKVTPVQKAAIIKATTAEKKPAVKKALAKKTTIKK